MNKNTKVKCSVGSGNMQDGMMFEIRDEVSRVVICRYYIPFEKVGQLFANRIINDIEVEMNPFNKDFDNLNKKKISLEFYYKLPSEFSTYSYICKEEKWDAWLSNVEKQVNQEHGNYYNNRLYIIRGDYSFKRRINNEYLYEFYTYED